MASPSALPHWFYLIQLSFRRQTRAHLMMWVALGLLGLSGIFVFINAQAGRWSMTHWRWRQPLPGEMEEIMGSDTFRGLQSPRPTSRDPIRH